jgi:hypothetical protein
MKTEQEFLAALHTKEGCREIERVVNLQLHTELHASGFARKAARLFKQQYHFNNEGRIVSVPTFELAFTHPGTLHLIKNSEGFALILKELIKKVAEMEDESLVNIVKWSAEAAEAGHTEGLKPVDADYDWDFERLLFPIGKAGDDDENGVRPALLVFHLGDYIRYAQRWMFTGEFSDHDEYKQGIVGYFRPRAFNQSYPVAIMVSRFVEEYRPIILGKRKDQFLHADELPILDIIMTEREAPTLVIEEGKQGIILTLKEKIGICASGKFVQQVRLPEWKEPVTDWPPLDTALEGFLDKEKES